MILSNTLQSIYLHNSPQTALAAFAPPRPIPTTVPLAALNQQFQSMHNKRTSKTNIKLPKIAPSPSKNIERNKLKPVKPEEVSSKFTAAAYGVFDEDLKSLAQMNSGVRREIASITKMMTMLLTHRLCLKYKINTKKCYFRVTVNAANMRGTSAELEARQWATVEDLLHGLMLPSGNDAATVLAENLGACLYYDRLGEAHLLVDLKSLDLTEDTWNIKIYSEQFVKLMNSTARQIGMKETNYVNPHGLDASFRLEAYSTAEDQALLAKTLRDIPECMKVMSTYEHIAELKTIMGKEVEIRKKTWRNTHLCLNEPGYVGGKTGQTQNAGNCLTTYFQSKRGNKFIIVVLGCLTKELRFVETRALVEQYIIPREG